MPVRRRATRLPIGKAPEPVAGEIYLEYLPVRGLLRVVAVDAATGVEVTVFGPSSVSRHDLERVAVRKLSRRLESRGRPERRGAGIGCI